MMKPYSCLDLSDIGVQQIADRRGGVKHDFRRHMILIARLWLGLPVRGSTKEDLPELLEWAMRLQHIINQKKSHATTS